MPEYDIVRAPEFLMNPELQIKKTATKYDDLPFAKLEIGDGFFMRYDDALYPKKTNIGSVLAYMGKRLNMKFRQYKFDETKIYIYRSDPAKNADYEALQMRGSYPVKGSPVGTD